MPNYDLRGYLQRIQQREWWGDADTEPILTEILALLGGTEVSRKATAIAPSPNPSGEVLDPPTIVESFAVTESVQMPPLPVAEPELPGGQVDLASQFYVERAMEGRASIEAQCYEAIAKPGALIRIKAPRQMGKTSLMSRILRQAEQQGCLGVLRRTFLGSCAIGMRWAKRVSYGSGFGWWWCIRRRCIFR